MYSWRSEIVESGIRLGEVTLVIPHKIYEPLRDHMRTFYADAHFEEACEDFFGIGQGQLCDRITITPNERRYIFEDIGWLEDIELLEDDDYENPFVTFMLDLEGFLRMNNVKPSLSVRFNHLRKDCINTQKV